MREGEGGSAWVGPMGTGRGECNGATWRGSCNGAQGTGAGGSWAARSTRRLCVDGDAWHRDAMCSVSSRVRALPGAPPPPARVSGAQNRSALTSRWPCVARFRDTRVATCLQGKAGAAHQQRCWTRSQHSKHRGTSGCHGTGSSSRVRRRRRRRQGCKGHRTCPHQPLSEVVVLSAPPATVVVSRGQQGSPVLCISTCALPPCHPACGSECTHPPQQGIQLTPNCVQ